MTLRGAIVGFGQVAEKAHLPGFMEHGVEIAAVAEGNPDRQKAVRELLPHAQVYTTLEELLAKERALSFLDIATPPFLHAPQALLGIKAGLHVLCEKPLALALEDLEALRRAAAITGRAVFTVHNWAYSPQWLKIFSLVAEGQVGEIMHVELNALRTQAASGALPDDWRKQAAQSGGGVLIDHGWHNLYLLYRLLKAKVTRLTARMNPVSGSVEDEATLFAEFPSATATMYLSWKSGIRQNTARVVGTKGVMDLEDDEIILTTPAGVEHLRFEAPLSGGSAHPTWFAAMLPDFFSEAADEKVRGRNLDEATFTLGLINRAYQSVRVGRSHLRATLTPQERARR